MGIRVGQGRYYLGRKIGSGSFGDVYQGKCVRNKTEVAIKLEACRSMHAQLHYEVRLYKLLASGYGIPSVFWHGTEGDYNVMVMEYLGPSLEDLFNFCARRFSLKTVLLLADQMICRLQFVHERNYVHRDIKPENFLIGNGTNSNTVYLVDFGLAKRYRDNRTKEHIMYRENKALTGTA